MPELKILITSHPNLALDTWFTDVAKIEISATHSDIGKFLEERIRKNRRLNKFLVKEPSLKSDIIDSIQSKAHGM